MAVKRTERRITSFPWIRRLHEFGGRQPQHLTDTVGAARDHRQPVEAHGDAGTWRQAVFQRGEEILIERPGLMAKGLAAQRMAAVAVGDEAGALLHRVGEFHEGIGEFDAADEQLEPFRHTRIGRIAAGQCGLRGGPMGQEGRVVAAKLGFDAIEQKAEEKVLPGLAAAQGHLGGCREALRVVADRQQVSADMAGEGVGDGQALETRQVRGDAATADDGG